jgi:hypothetical protein
MRVLLAFAVLMCALAAAQAEPPAGPAIYLQRGPDGKIVFTDRPDPGATTERTWRFDPEDPKAVEAAEARREASRVRAAEVNERISRGIEEQQRRELEMEIERLRLSQTQAALDFERERAALQDPSYVDTSGPYYWGGQRHWRGHRRPPPHKGINDDLTLTRPKQKPASLRK